MPLYMLLLSAKCRIMIQTRLIVSWCHINTLIKCDKLYIYIFNNEFARSALWSRSRSTRTSAKWRARTRATSTRWISANILRHVGYVIHLCIVFALIIGEPGVRSDTKTRGGCRKTPHLDELCELLFISVKKHCRFEKKAVLFKF